MRRSSFVVAAVCCFIAATATRGAVDVDADVPQNAGLQLIVVEAKGCDYCGNFRRDILPVYESSERAKRVPVRFVDVNDIDSADLALNAPVELVPTFVLAQRGKEVGRIPGYVSLHTFFQSISYLLSIAD